MRYKLSHLDLHACDHYMGPGPVAQLVASLTADPRVVSSILAHSHTSVEIDHEIISMVFLLLPLIQEGLLSVKSKSMWRKYWFAEEKVWLGELTIST